MRTRIAVPALLMAGVLLMPALPAFASPAGGGLAFSRARAAVPGEVIVRYRSGVTASARRALRAGVGARLHRSLRLKRTELVKLAPGEDVARAIASLQTDPNVQYAEPNYLRHVQVTTPSDPRLGDLWGLDNAGQAVNGTTGTADADIDAPEAWDLTTGSSGVTVAVMDSGVAYDNPDLAPNMVSGWDFVSDDNDPRDFNGHGTHVAGTIAARGNDGYGVSGVSWSSKIMPLRVLDGDGNGAVSTLVDAFAYASDNGAKVLNGSLGGGMPSLAERDAIAAASGTMFVFAAGNESTNNDATASYPCNYGSDFNMSNVLCVAATDQNDASPSFSNYGANSVDLAAPGVNVLSTQPAYGAPIFSDGFETDLAGRWTTTGAWGRSATPNTGSYSLADSPDGNYANDVSSSARLTNPLSLAGQVGCKLEYQLRLSTELNVDGVTVQASSDGSSWTILDTLSGSTLGSFTGMTNSLSSFDGSSTVYIQFTFESDADTTGDGAYVDDVDVKCLSGTYDGTELAYESGTSMATPYVSGVAALLFAKDPTTTPAIVRNTILSNVDPVAALTTRTLSGGRLNADKALRLVNPLDTSAPTGARITSSAFAAPFQKTLKLPVSWTASDVGTGVATYSVRYRRAKYSGAFGSFTLWKDGTRATSTTFTGAAGYAYCFSAAARDHVGNLSAWGTERCTAFPVNDRSLSASGWTRASGSGYYLSTYSQRTTKGATMKLTGVRFKRLILVATTCSGCGSVQVKQGSTVLKAISLSASSTHKEQLLTVLTRSSLSPSSTISIVISSSGKPVKIEGLGISAA